MEGKLGRRVVVFGRTIVVVWLLSAAAWLQKQDSCDLRDDVHDLKLMAVLDSIEPSTDLQDLEGPTFEHALEWIAAHHPQIDEARVDVRTQFVEWLHQRGVPQMQIGRLSGKMSAPAVGATTFRFISLQDLPATPSSNDDPSEPWSLQTSGLAANDVDDDFTAQHEQRRFVVTVAHLLDELEQLTARRQLVCATSVDQQLLTSIRFARSTPQTPAWEFDLPEDAQARFDDGVPVVSIETASPGAADYGGPAPGIPSGETTHAPLPMGIATGRERERRAADGYQEDLLFRSAALAGDGIEVCYEWMRPPGEMVQQMDQDAFMDRARAETVPVSTTLLEGAPCLLELSDPVRSANAALCALGTDVERMSYLRRAYGHMPLDDATEIASDGLTQAYRTMTLFGFRFSTRRFPLAVLFCLIAALWQTLAALIAMRRRQVRLLAEIIDDATIETLVANPVARFFLWVVMPLTALWTSLPLVPLSESESQLLIYGAAVVAILGAACVGTVEVRPKRHPPDESGDTERDATTPHFAPHIATGADRRSRSPRS